MSASRQIVCPRCAGINRVPVERSAEAALCGRCKTPLFSGKPLDVDAAMFEQQTMRGDIPVLLDVWAPWCGPCRMMAPAFEAAAGMLEPEVRLLKLDTDAQPAIASRLSVRSIPTMILFSGGREIGRVSGAMTAQQIVSWAREKQTAA